MKQVRSCLHLHVHLHLIINNAFASKLENFKERLSQTTLQLVPLEKNKGLQSDL